jgi:hypothetical protein
LDLALAVDLGFESDLGFCLALDFGDVEAGVEGIAVVEGLGEGEGAVGIGRERTCVCLGFAVVGVANDCSFIRVVQFGLGNEFSEFILISPSASGAAVIVDVFLPLFLIRA